MNKFKKKLMAHWLEWRLDRIYAKTIYRLQTDVQETQRTLLDTGQTMLPRRCVALKIKYNTVFNRLKQLDPTTQRQPLL